MLLLAVFALCSRIPDPFRFSGCAGLTRWVSLIGAGRFGFLEHFPTQFLESQKHFPPQFLESQKHFPPQFLESQKHFATQFLESQEHFAPQFLESQEHFAPQFLESQEHFSPQDPELFRIPGAFRSPGSGTFQNPRNISFPMIRNSFDSHEHFVPQEFLISPWAIDHYDLAPRTPDHSHSQEHFDSQDFDPIGQFQEH